VRPRRVIDGRSVLFLGRLLRDDRRRLRLGIVGDESSAVEERVGGSGRRGGRGAERVEPLPGERGAEEGERLAGAGRRLEERVRLPLPPRAVERGDDPPHERQLRPVGLVGELHRHAAHMVHAPVSPRSRGGRRRCRRRDEVVGVGVDAGHGGAAHRRVAERIWAVGRAGGIGGKCEAKCCSKSRRALRGVYDTFREMSLLGRMARYAAPV